MMRRPRYQRVKAESKLANECSAANAGVNIR
jgi:hypothetical protein